MLDFRAEFLEFRMDLIAHVSRQFEENANATLASIEALAAPIALAVETLTETLFSNGKILACGNGGSAAGAQHFTSELIGRFERERPELAALALTTDASVLTSTANEESFEQVFARQVRGLGQAGDTLLAICPSGNSANILAAIDAAHQRDIKVIALSGEKAGKMAEMLNENDVLICVPHQRSARVQEIHLLIIHCLCDGIDCLLLGAES